MGSIPTASHRQLSSTERYRLEQAAQAISRSAQASQRSIGINWRRLASSTISEHYHVEYPGLSNEQIAIRETLDEAVRKVSNHELDFNRLDTAGLQGTLEDILSDILDFMVHDAVASSSDNSDGGSGPDSSDEEDDDESDDASDDDSMGQSNNHRRREAYHSDDEDHSSGSESDSASDSSDDEPSIHRHQYNQHPHHHLLRHEAGHNHCSNSLSRNSSSKCYGRRSRREVITIKRRQRRIPSPSPSGLNDATPRGRVAPLALVNGPISPAAAN